MTELVLDIRYALPYVMIFVFLFTVGLLLSRLEIDQSRKRSGL